MSSAGANDDGLTLNLNPMLDIFSILITFLLMSFSTDPVNYEPGKAVELPESRTLASLDEIPLIVVSENEISVQGESVVPILAGGDVESREVSQGAIFQLYQKLKDIHDFSVKRSEALRVDRNKLDAVTLEVDKKHTFKLLKRVFLSAQQAEYISFKLMVAKNAI